MHTGKSESSAPRTKTPPPRGYPSRARTPPLAQPKGEAGTRYPSHARNPPPARPREQAGTTQPPSRRSARTPPPDFTSAGYSPIEGSRQDRGSSSRQRASSERPTALDTLGRDGSTFPIDVEAAAASLAAPKVDMVQGESREDLCEILEKTPFMAPGHELFMHGRAYNGPQKNPKVIWESQSKPRDDHDCPSWLNATEFVDQRDVMRAKIACLANLIKASHKTVLYTGAGISASVVGQAARSGQNTVGFEASPLSAKPTPTHFALASLGIHNLIHGWVQQNHDGLPQKAGFPQYRINEVHGSWFDPCNPVVKYSGSLHDRAHPWMVEDADTSDLVLVLGTSLGGLNADQVAMKAAERSLSKAALGTVCINLQQTPQDDKMTLRLFGKSDDILQMLHLQLGLGPVPTRPPRWPSKCNVLVPYDMNGCRVDDTEEQWMWLDLRDRAKIRITPGHNIQGACQPHLMHIGASRRVKVGGVMRQPAEGLGTILRREEHSFLVNIEGESFHLGVWWLVDAINGSAHVLPLVNQKPVFAAKDKA